MKKFLLIIFSICSCLCVQIRVYADEITHNQENFFSQNDLNKEDPYPTIPTPEYKPAFFRMLLILIALIALIFFTFWIFRRLMRMRVHQANLTKNIKILEKRVISPKSMLYVIEIEGRRVLISESNLEVRKIKDID